MKLKLWIPPGTKHQVLLIKPEPHVNDILAQKSFVPHHLDRRWDKTFLGDYTDAQERQQTQPETHQVHGKSLALTLLDKLLYLPSMPRRTR